MACPWSVQQAFRRGDQGKFPVGILTHTDYPEFTKQYQQIIDRCMAEKERQNNGK